MATAVSDSTNARWFPLILRLRDTSEVTGQSPLPKMVQRGEKRQPADTPEAPSNVKRPATRW
jgi:hypothetical protein